MTTAAQTSTGPECFLQSGGILRELRACAQGSGDAPPGTGRRVPTGAEWGGDRWGAWRSHTRRAQHARPPPWGRGRGHAGEPVHASHVWETKPGDRRDTHTADDPHRQGQRPGQLRQREGRKQDSTFMQRLFN